MKKQLVSFLLLSSVVFTVSLVGNTVAHRQPQTTAANPSREQAYRANNLGVALLEQFKHKEGVDAFRRALQLDPKLTLARLNLSIALFNVPDFPAAQKEAQSAIALSPESPQPYYVLGLIAKAQNRGDDALVAFQHVLKIDSSDVGANINVGQLYSQQRKYPEAISAFRVALVVEPYNGTALYGLGTALLRGGQRDEGQREIARFQELRQRGSGTTLGPNYLEQGRYAEAVASTGAETELVDRAIPAVTFNDSPGTFAGLNETKTPAVLGMGPVFGRQFNLQDLNENSRREIAAALGGAATLFDFDGDGDLDLFWAGISEQHLYRNDKGKFTDITSQSPSLTGKLSRPSIAAVAGDYDNDGRPDLFVVRDGSLALYHNDGGGKFSDITAAAAIPAYSYLPSSAAFVDVDHDGDLDLFVAGLADLSKVSKRGPVVFPNDFAGAPSMLLRNDGNGKFTDITTAAKIDQASHAIAIVPTDFNNRRDVDLLIVKYGAPPSLFSNQRDGTFRDVAGEVGLTASGNWTCAAAGDLNKDSYTDFFFGRADGPGLFAMSDGKEKFKTTAAPAGIGAVHAAQFLDYDNDGLLDCVLLSDNGIHVWRNLGDGWVDCSERAVAAVTPASANSPISRVFASGDVDDDGDTDLISLSTGGELRLARNDGGNNNHSLRVNLSGKVSNRSGIGAKLEARAGSLVQKLETSSASPAPVPADILFGLGKRDSADAVRVLWPAGIVQAETEIANAGTNAGAAKRPATITLSVTELDRKPSSCPYLYTWNGKRFEFITDFMGGGEMGYLEEPGRYNKPDPDEYVRITTEQLKERRGRYELRVTNELEEALFVDRLQLIVVAHPEGAEVYPNEGMTDPPRRFVVYQTKAAHPPLAATDEHGHDVLERISYVDRKYADDFARDRIRGYADKHTLTLKLAADVSAKRTLLLLTGWTDYSWSSDNVAAAQAGKGAMLPALQVKDASGLWHTVIEDVGIPVGRPQTVTVDLTGKFLSNSREVRIVTNMRILWDQILVDTSRGLFPTQMTKLDPVVADLHWRGFSREITPDGHEPFGYDYEKVSFSSPWKVMSGRYTREGDVRPLLLHTDDMFVISRPGDEIGLSFDARTLPALPRGWKRTFLLYADGFSKEMDINSASPDQVLPLPFHGMSKYPYTAPEAYPMTTARQQYMDRYNTRLVRAEVSSIDSIFAETGLFSGLWPNGKTRDTAQK